jgi:hypothetical protein
MSANPFDMPDGFEEIFKSFGNSSDPIKPKDGSSISDLIKNMEHNSRFIKKEK